VGIFEGVGENALVALAAQLELKTVAKDEQILREGAKAHGMFLILKGHVKVSRHGENGKEVILVTFKPGDFFGEMSLLDELPRSASVIATELTQLLFLSRGAFISHLRSFPMTSLNILEVMSVRLRRADDIIGNLALLDVFGRVARVLIDLAEREGQECEDGVMIAKRPTQSDLAAMSGATRESVSRVLAELQRRELLQMSGKTLHLSCRLMDHYDMRA